MDLRPDELIGPLCAQMGGRAARLKVLDVRVVPAPELLVVVDGVEDAWRVRNVEGLVTALNERFADDEESSAVALLGEWDEMLQLWCIKKRLLPKLLSAAWFTPANRPALQVLITPP
jgi:hypothetical protein